MPLSTSLRKLLCCKTGIQEEDEAEARPPRPETAQVWPAQMGRPYRDYVENEAERYWRDIGKERDLVKPAQREIRSAALLLLRQAQRNRPGPKLNPELNLAQMAVDAMHLHAAASGWITPPYTRPQACANHVEALIQLADAAGWLAREIPLPDRPAPKHPVIYYTTDPATGRPVPREDALIRGDHLYIKTGKRLTGADYIYPWQGAGGRPRVDDFTSRGWDACYSLERTGNKVEIMVHRLYRFSALSAPVGIISSRIEGFYFSPNPPQQAGGSASGRRESRGRGARRTAASGTRGSGAGATGMLYF